MGFGKQLLFLLLIGLLTTSSVLEARPFCSDIIPLPVERWTSLDDQADDHVFELEAEKPGTLFFAWRSAQGPLPSRDVSWIGDACDGPGQELQAAARGVLYLPRAGTYLLRFSAGPDFGGAPAQAEVRAHFSPSRVPGPGTADEVTRAGQSRAVPQASAALGCLARLQQLHQPIGAEIPGAIPTWMPWPPEGLEEWEIDILSLGEDPEEGDPWSDATTPQPDDLEEWEIDILSANSETDDSESLWSVWEELARSLIGAEAPDLSADPTAVFGAWAVRDPSARLEAGSLFVGAPGMLEVTLDEGEAVEVQRRVPGYPSRRVALAPPGPNRSLRIPVAPGVYSFTLIAPADSRGLDRSDIRIYALCP